MKTTHSTAASTFLAELLGTRSWSLLQHAVAQPVSWEADDSLDRGQAAMALGLVLLADLCERVPYARAYTQECARSGRPLVFDHGTMRTVALEVGEIPSGRQAVARLLAPFGYEQTKVYPLDRLGMTGFVYTHRDFPEELPQYFVSELYPERFSEEFQSAAQGLLSTSTDPLPRWASDELECFHRTGELPLDEAVRLIHAVAACFDRNHRDVTVEEYELFLAESAEMAWIATEGHAFNHITDRVLDVPAVAAQQRALGRPVKDEVEVSSTGRVVQTAFRAAEVERLMLDGDRYVARRVPGSFLEFIARAPLEDGTLDLAFDAQNAQAIFKMTDGAAA